MNFLLLHLFMPSLLCRPSAEAFFEEEDYQSLHFQLPDSGDNLGQKCLQYSQFFCLTGTWFTRQQSNRPSRNQDFYVFLRLVRENYRKYNWFSFDERDQGQCCRFQTEVYMQHGQPKGLSPSQYFNSTVDFAPSQPKSLNFIGARFEPSMCANIISRVGFGRGRIQINGVHPGYIYLFPVIDSHTVHFFTYRHVTEELTFDWFKRNIVCRDQPWICQTQT
ncbi:uncharacterized protein LOC142349519 [Convolutriloba macropyga]|uniref:uncharacterized protein LOC142349519 n=1 Tax=Convolutriloba macropyga TaxID=536237 RepID=UPI003F526784